jgi:hypothetical protein
MIIGVDFFNQTASVYFYFVNTQPAENDATTKLEAGGTLNH